MALYGKGGQRARMMCVCVWYRCGRANRSPPSPQTPPHLQCGSGDGDLRLLEGVEPSRQVRWQSESADKRFHRECDDEPHWPSSESNGDNRQKGTLSRVSCAKVPGCGSRVAANQQPPAALTSISACSACKLMPCLLRSRLASQRPLAVISQGATAKIHTQVRGFL